MKKVFLLSLFLLLSPLSALAVESCEGLFEPKVNTAPSADVAAYLVFKDYAKEVLKQKRPRAETVKLLLKTEYARKADWHDEDIVFFINHLYSHIPLYPETAALNLVFQAKSEGLKKISSERPTKEQRNAGFAKFLLGDGLKKPDLKLTWRVTHPENPTQVGNAYWRLRSLQDVTVDYIIDPMWSDPYRQIARGNDGLPPPDLKFYEQLFKNYEGRIRDGIMEKIEIVETDFSDDRQGYGVVANSATNEVLGTVRVFDGTPFRLNEAITQKRKRGRPNLPFEQIFAIRNIPVKFIEKIKRMRVESPYTPIFEIGKLSLLGPPAVRDRSMKALEYFLLDYYMDRYPDAIIVVHVATDAHLSLYQKRYGFEIEETIKIPGTDQVERILTLSGEKFRAALQRRLDL